MSLQQLESPPPYSHDLNDLKLPSLPAAHFHPRTSPQLPTLEPLPSLSAIANGFDTVHNPRLERDPLHNPRAARQRIDMKSLQLPGIRSMVSGELSSPTEVGSVSSMDDYPRRRDTGASMQDADDRMAAEALCGLGKLESDLVQPAYNRFANQHPHDLDHRRTGASDGEPEPLLSLLTTSHPWLGGTINGSLSAYSSTKSYSPRFIQYGAEIIERNIGSPVASTVGTVGRRTGVEGSIRRYLGSRRTSELDHIDPEILDQDICSKRRRIEAASDDGMDMEQGTSEPVHRTVSGHSSIDTLPAYDNNRSPEYEESTAVLETPKPYQRQFRPAANRSWSTQLMITTSGLGVALNEASLRSLKYCLNILRIANTRIRELMEALRRLLTDFDNGPQFTRNLEDGKSNTSSGPGSEHVETAMELDPATNDRERAAQEEHAHTLAQHIRRLNDEIWHTLKNVVNSVSKYTGGALPDNASGFVKWQLMSVPRRWQLAVSRSSPETLQHEGQGGEYDAVRSAHRMLEFAYEGLDMMDKVSGVVDTTIVSAEGWLETMGRRSRDQERGESNMVGGLQGKDGDGQVTPTPMDMAG